MMRLVVIGTLLVADGWGVVSSTFSSSTGTKQVNSKSLLNEPKLMLEKDDTSMLKKIDCSAFYESDYGGEQACYVSKVESEKIVQSIQELLKPIALSGGWRQDYGVYGSFYEMKETNSPGFGITVSPVEGDFELEGIEAIKNYANFVTLSVNKPK